MIIPDLLEHLTTIVKKATKESISGLMAQCTKVIGKTTISMVWDSTHGTTTAFISVNGMKTKCKGTENIIREKELSIMVSSMMTKKKAMEFILGLMAEITTDGGNKENNMGWEYTQILIKALLDMDSGKMENE
jgi:hypothetical protein